MKVRRASKSPGNPPTLWATMACLTDLRCQAAVGNHREYNEEHQRDCNHPDGGFPARLKKYLQRPEQNENERRSLQAQLAKDSSGRGVGDARKLVSSDGRRVNGCGQLSPGFR